MSNDLSKDEVIAMAREAGFEACRGQGLLQHVPEDVFAATVNISREIERFATLARAPLVAENAALKQAHETNADTLNAMQVEIDDWKARALAASERETCTWTEQDDKDMPGTYESSCGEMWSFIEGGVKENRVTYCHHCGGKVVPASPQEQT